MNNLVEVRNSEEYGPVTTSRIVANGLGKRHSNVVRDLENILENSNVSSVIIPTTYRVNNQKRSYKEYLLTKDGFTLYMFNIQGHNDFKIAYINRFNEMEQKLKDNTISGLGEQPKIDQEYTLEKKTYKGLPVMTVKDLSYITGLDTGTINYHVGYNNINRILLEKDDLREYKEENKNVSNMVANLLIFDKKAVEDILVATKKSEDCTEVVNNYFKVDEIEKIEQLESIIAKHRWQVVRRQFIELLTKMDIRELINLRRDVEKEHYPQYAKDWLYRHIDIQIDIVLNK